MREIKFRAWNGFSMGKPSTMEEIVSTIVPGWFQSWDDLALMQYTGIKDKSGIEIYEGDIIRTLQHTSTGKLVSAGNVPIKVVKWVSKNGKGIKFTGYSLYCDGIYEIIGNIYENPSLNPNHKEPKES